MKVAERLGCFGCHGSLGQKGIRNPGSWSESVPSWSGGTHMMYVNDETEIREWILYGIPARLQKDETYLKKLEKALIQMPSFKGALSESELNDLIIFYKSVSWYEDLEGDAAEGRELAFNHGCFGCHGIEGRGLTRNHASLKGYIPPWEGDDFKDLVRDDDEFHEWVMNGNIRRLKESPAASHFTDNQKIQMPAYKGFITDEEIKKILAFVKWVRKEK
jgi:mono/diheme cytochrome c family protein